jgi:eukaryotic-like serine/threonine-protein kinase
MPESIAHYNLLERIGEGGLGEVYRARDTKVGRTVALKLPSPALLSDVARRSRFLEDARAAMSLSHPNIATLFDTGEDNGRWYLAYEFAQGGTLRQQIGGRPMHTRQAIEVAVQLADALAEAHSRGILHMDLRPETVIITSKGSSKILDFGMAAWTRGGAARARAGIDPESLTPEMLRVAAYLSPEQALGTATDARTDVFSLGVIVYEMLTGRNPFAAPTASATLTNIARKPPPPVRTLHPDLPPEFETILSRALAKDVAARHESAASIAAELRSIGAVLDVRAGDSPPGELLPIDDDEEGTGKWWLVAVLAIAAIAIGWWMLRR